MKAVGPTFAFLLILLLLGAMIAPWFFTQGASSGDFTWRTQAMLRTTRVGIPIAWIMVVVIVALSPQFRGGSAGQRGCWVAALGSFAIVGVLSWYMKTSLEDDILAWNPGWPPATWTEIRDRWARWNWIRVAGAAVAFWPWFFALEKKAPVSTPRGEDSMTD